MSKRKRVDLTIESSAVLVPKTEENTENFSEHVDKILKIHHQLLNYHIVNVIGEGNSKHMWRPL